nr:MAG TPA: hypothetical protein [Caudoviricetes sp.]
MASPFIEVCSSHYMLCKICVCSQKTYNPSFSGVIGL